MKNRWVSFYAGVTTTYKVDRCFEKLRDYPERCADVRAAFVWAAAQKYLVTGGEHSVAAELTGRELDDWAGLIYVLDPATSQIVSVPCVITPVVSYRVQVSEARPEESA